MTRYQSLSWSLPIALLVALAGCRTYEHLPDIASEEFDTKQSLGSIEVRYQREQRDSPTLRSAFRRKIIEPDMGSVGTYVIGMVYPTAKIGEDYSSLTLKGEKIGDDLWRFKIPYKRLWNGPQDLYLHFPNTWEERGQSFLFRFLEGQSCLNDYSLETPGNPTLHVSVNLKEPGCLLPCTAKLSDPATCSNFWR